MSELMKNRTLVEVYIPANDSNVMGLGIHCGGNAMVSASGLSAVETIQAIGGSTMAAETTM
jgi:hypothetical protein